MITYIATHTHTRTHGIPLAVFCKLKTNRTLLEIHHDDHYVQNWKAQRKGEYTVLHRVALAHRTKLCMQLELPRAVKDALQKPKNENN